MNWLVTTIVVPSDGSPAMDAQLASARALARTGGARVLVVHVTAAARDGGDEKQSQERVLEQVEALRGAGVRAELEVHESDQDLSRAIAAFAGDRRADVIVTRRGRPWTSHGGVAACLLRIAPCPVLITP